MTVAVPDEHLDDLLLNLPTPQLTYVVRSLIEAAAMPLHLLEWTNPNDVWGGGHRCGQERGREAKARDETLR